LCRAFTSYTPPEGLDVWNKESGGRFASINRPIAGPTHEKELPVGRHPLQLYSLATPERRQKVTVMLEELLALGHSGAEYDAWLIRIDGDQFGSGFRRGQSELQDPGADGPQRPKPIRVFESGAILLHLAEKFGAFLPTGGRRAECLSWLFWQMGSAPYLGGGFGHFYAYAPTKIEYAIDRFAMEVKRQLDVLDRRLADSEYLAATTTRSPTSRSGPGTAAWPRACSTGGEFLSVQDYKNVQRWTDAIAERPAVKRGRMVNRAFRRPRQPAARTPRRQRFRHQDAGQDRGKSVQISRRCAEPLCPSGRTRCNACSSLRQQCGLPASVPYRPRRVLLVSHQPSLLRRLRSPHDQRRTAQPQRSRVRPRHLRQSRHLRARWRRVPFRPPIP
jgi:GST-like protein